MHLRRLIVLIINARNIINQSPLLSSGKGLHHRADVIRCITASVLIGQIKKNHSSRTATVPPRGCRVKQTVLCLFTMSKDPVADTSQCQHNQTCSLFLRRIFGPVEPAHSSWRPAPFEHSSHGLLAFDQSTGLIDLPHRQTGYEVVEPDGIEPTTSCLQSRRSPS